MRSWNFPDPWPGGTWRLRDIVDYQVSANLAIAGHAAAHREHWLRTMYEVNRRAARRTSPFAFVVPGEQKDPFAGAALLSVLRTGAVEVHRARSSFEAGGRKYAKGSHVVLMQQPFSGFAKSLLERQRYPDIRSVPGGPPQRPYDVTAHTLPLLMGVDVDEIAERFTADLEPVERIAVAPGRIEKGRGRFLAFGHRTGDLVALGRLLRAGVPVRWARAAFRDGPREFPAGTLLAPESARAALAPLAAELGLVARPVRRAPPSFLLRAPRVGLYQSWVTSHGRGMDALRLRAPGRRPLPDAARPRRPRRRPRGAVRRHRAARSGGAGDRGRPPPGRVAAGVRRRASGRKEWPPCARSSKAAAR